MRISDWSSDVCSSDLQRQQLHAGRRAMVDQHQCVVGRDAGVAVAVALPAAGVAQPGGGPLAQGTAGLAMRRGVGRERGDREHRQPLIRSEEHTSELQSLMPISYALYLL